MLYLYALPVLLGIAVCLQGTANGLLSGRIGLPLTLSINSGLVFAGSLTWLFFSRMSATPSPERLGAPWLYYSGGLSGLVIISAAAVAFPRLGATTTTVLAVASQIGTALVLDRYGLTGHRIPLNAVRLLGVALVVTGVALVFGLGDRFVR
ncbi:MAG TPA: DMT family transporter [Planctomycetota bacterium]|nr:DMT family transporter [Planctomycetota bacterium]